LTAARVDLLLARPTVPCSTCPPRQASGSASTSTSVERTNCSAVFCAQSPTHRITLPEATQAVRTRDEHAIVVVLKSTGSQSRHAARLCGLSRHVARLCGSSTRRNNTLQPQSTWAPINCGRSSAAVNGPIILQDPIYVEGVLCAPRDCGRLPAANQTRPYYFVD
jgi:hypothetical protein